jgi:hypothetical protein
VMGTIAILVGASVGAIIDIAYDGSIIPLATAGLVGAAIAGAFFVWADRVWEDAQELTSDAPLADS